MLLTSEFPVHQEPGEDKVIFADDVAAWILKRSEKSS